MEALRHNAWATLVLLDFCKGLSDDELHASGIRGASGSIYATLQHFVVAEGNYRQSITGEFPRHWGWFAGERPSLEELEDRTRDSANFWEDLFAKGVTPDVKIHYRGSNGSSYESNLGVLIAQTLNHGNHHRAEICVMLTQLGNEPPDLSGLGYGEASGRSFPHETSAGRPE